MIIKKDPMRMPGTSRQTHGARKQENLARLLDTDKDVEAIPPTNGTEKIQLALTIYLTQNEHLWKIVWIKYILMKESNWILPLFVGILNPKVKSILVSWSFQPSTKKLGKNFIAGRIVIKPNKFYLTIDWIVWMQREPFVRDPLIVPTIPTSTHKL
jgi:hypothetical protein